MPHETSHAAKINDQGIVEQVIVIPYLSDDDSLITEYCNSLGLEGKWIDCSYLGNRRGRYPGIGFVYNEVLDVFIEPQPDPSFVLDSNYNWIAPEENETISLTDTELEAEIDNAFFSE